MTGATKHAKLAFTLTYGLGRLGHRTAPPVAESDCGAHEENGEEQTTSWLLYVGDADRHSDVHNHYSDRHTAICQDCGLFARSRRSSLPQRRNGAGQDARRGRLYACTVAASPVFNLAQGDTFGTGGLTQGPTIAQQPTIPAQVACQSTNGGNGTIANTECIVFNSRGIPIDANGAPLPTGAVYLTNLTVVNGVTVSATGSIQAWTSPVSSVSWRGQ